MAVRVVVCPDKFAGTLSAVDAAAALAAGWLSARPGDSVEARPLSDGGPGFLDVLGAAVEGHAASVSTVDPLGRPVPGSVLVADSTAYIESAQACGLHLVRPEERNPRNATSYGLGPLLAAAVESGVRTVVLGLGGSATTDAGAGMLAALGAVPLDEAGYALPYGGAALLGCFSLSGPPRLRGVDLVAATDVDNPLVGLYGAANVFGPQKGATREDVLLLDAALTRFAAVLVDSLDTCPPDLATLPGGGAAGGLGAAVLALGGRCESGIELIRTVSGLDTALDRADLVITGEGSFDAQSLRGKVVAGVAAAARDRGLPCLVVAGRVEVGRRDAAAVGVVAAHSLVEHVGEAAALADPARGLRSLGTRLAERWSR